MAASLGSLTSNSRQLREGNRTTKKMVKGEREAEEKAWKEKNRRREMAYKARTREILCSERINVIVSLTDARWVWWNSCTRESGILKHRHKWVQCVDSSTQDLTSATSSTRWLVKHEHGFSDKPCDACSEAILIHCDLGISRSPTIMREYGTKREDVLAFVRSKQKVKPSANSTQVWEEVGYQVWENGERTVPKAPYRAFLDDRAALLKEKGLTGNEPLAPLYLD
ncbi:dual specificity protein phosphatase [Elaphomyces granulatus]